MSGPAGPPSRLAREMGLLGLTATGVCSMVGAGINVIPFMIQRNVPGIGPHVLPAYAFAALPAVLAGLAYAMLGLGDAARRRQLRVRQPRARVPTSGSSPRSRSGSRCASRSASCRTCWCRSCATSPSPLDWHGVGRHAGTRSRAAGDRARRAVDGGGLNLRGVALYERLIVPLMFLTFALGGVVIVAGFAFDHADFAAALAARGDGRIVPAPADAPLSAATLLARGGAAVRVVHRLRLHRAGRRRSATARPRPAAGDRHRRRRRSACSTCCSPRRCTTPCRGSTSRPKPQRRDLTAPGPARLSAAAVLDGRDRVGALRWRWPRTCRRCCSAVSRLMFAWAEDGIFPARGGRPCTRASARPHVAIVASGAMATLGILGSHLAGDFFLGVDILVTSMLVNFLLMAVSVLTLPARNPALARAVTVLPSRALQVPLWRSSASSCWPVSSRCTPGRTSRRRPPRGTSARRWLWAIVMAARHGRLLARGACAPARRGTSICDSALRGAAA